jgi:hypothetical protein
MVDIISSKHMPEVQAIIDGQTDISSLTKAQISSFASDIGLDVPTSLTKAKMVDSVIDSDEFYSYEMTRKTKESWKIINNW